MQKLELRVRNVRGKKQTRVRITSPNGELTLTGENVHNRSTASNMLNNLIKDIQNGRFRVLEVVGIGKHTTTEDITREFTQEETT